jgi:GNAT superfamily N-acetyltransferase
MMALFRRLVIRPATVADAELIASVYVPSWRATYRNLLPPEALVSDDESQWAARFRSQHDPGRETLVALRGKQPIGMVSFGPDREDAAYGEIYAVYVLPRSQGRGIGRKLLAEALAALGQRDVRIWCATANTRARDHYAHHGFLADGCVGTYDFAGHSVPTVRYVLRR